MGVSLRVMVLCAWAGLAASGQTLNNQSLTGPYFFREVLIATDTSQVQTMYGTLTFTGSGGFQYNTQTLNGSSAPVASSGSSGVSYSVLSSGVVTLGDPLRTGTQINARFNNGILIGSNTEAGNNVVSLFVAMPVPASPPALNTLSGSYWVGSLEFPNGNLGLARETLFQMISNGSGGFGSPLSVGEAVNLGNHQMSQTVTGVTYAINPDGSVSLNLPLTSADATQQLIGGAKTVYISSDGSLFVGGGTGSGGEGIVVGIRQGTNLTKSALNSTYWSADLYLRGQVESASVGAAAALGNGTATWTKRLRTNGGPLDVTTVTNYNVTPNGSGSMLDNQIAVSANGAWFLGSGLAALDTDRYELFLGVLAPKLTAAAPGMFLNPQGVVNVFSFAPAGNPIAPGEFIRIFGSGLPAQPGQVVPFPTTLNGVQLLINNTPAPLYLIDATDVYAVVPYALTGSTADIVLKNGAASSNTITVPVALTSPGVASQAQNGLGLGAITHADGSLVNVAAPAVRGETVVLYLTGLGAVTPAVKDGTAAPSSTLAKSNSVLSIYLNGVCPNAPNCNASNIAYQGLTPGYAGLYQVNFTIPLTSDAGAAVPLAIETTNGFADMVTIAIQ